MNELFTLERKLVSAPGWPTPGFQLAAHVPLVTSAGRLLAPASFPRQNQPRINERALKLEGAQIT